MRKTDAPLDRATVGVIDECTDYINDIKVSSLPLDKKVLAVKRMTGAMHQGATLIRDTLRFRRRMPEDLTEVLGEFGISKKALGKK